MQTREQRAERLDRMLARHEQGATYRQVGAEFGISAGRARDVIVRELWRRAHVHWSDKLSMRTINCLVNFFLDRDFLDLPEREAAERIARFDRGTLLRIPNFGKQSILELQDWLHSLGLTLARRHVNGTAEGRPVGPWPESIRDVHQFLDRIGVPLVGPDGAKLTAVDRIKTIIGREP